MGLEQVDLLVVLGGSIGAEDTHFYLYLSD